MKIFSEMDELRVKLLNLDIIWKNKSANFKIIENEFEKQHADVLVLPEMFSTGFCMEAEEIADRNEETLQWMQSFAQQKNAAVCGSASIFENGKFFNRMYFVKPDGSYDHYDKRHLFSYSGEDEIYTPGDERKIVEYQGIRFLLQVCYDLRFPVFSRNNDDYDAVIYVANWPKTRVEAWNHLLKARAIENLAYVIGCNRIGTDGNHLDYVESSHTFFADGSQISTKNGNILTSEIHLQDLKNFREKFQFLNDRDRFEIL